jgi:hypothetical protein
MLINWLTTSGLDMIAFSCGFPSTMTFNMGYFMWEAWPFQGHHQNGLLHKLRVNSWHWWKGWHTIHSFYRGQSAKPRDIVLRLPTTCVSVS